VQDLLVAGPIDHHEVVVVELADLDHPHLGAIPAVLVVQHHRLTHQRFQLRHPMRVLHDVVPAVAGIVWIVGQQVIR
jgi:hypothetical protein